MEQSSVPPQHSSSGGGYKSLSADTNNFQVLKTNSRCINSALEGSRKVIFNVSFSNRTYLLEK